MTTCFSGIIGYVLSRFYLFYDFNKGRTVSNYDNDNKAEIARGEPIVDFRDVFNSDVKSASLYIMFEFGFMVITFLFFVILLKESQCAFQLESTTARVLVLIKSILFNFAAIALLSCVFFVSLFKIDEHFIKRSVGPVDEGTFSLLVHKSQYARRARAVFYALSTTVLLVTITMSVMYEVLLSPLGMITLFILLVLCVRGFKSIGAVKLDMVVERKTAEDDKWSLYL